MEWPAVARSCVETFERARAEHGDRLRTAFMTRTVGRRPARSSPDVSLDHLKRMTDSTGILEHAIFDVPRYEDGYCLDDNARALLLVTLLEDGGTDDTKMVRELATRYPAFVEPCLRRRARAIPDTSCLSPGNGSRSRGQSEDSHGRALWALGTVVGRSGAPGRQSLAGKLFHDALPRRPEVHEPARLGTYTLLGIDEYLRAFHGDTNVQAEGRLLAERLLDLYRRTKRSLVAVVRGEPHLLQRPTPAGTPRVRRVDGERRDEVCVIAIARLARKSPGIGRWLLRARRLEWLLRARADQGCLRPAAGGGDRNGVRVSGRAAL